MKRIACIICFFVVSNLTAQVGIGTTSPDASSVLDVVATDKGILVPRVSLVNITDGTTPIASPTTSLLVWNTNAAVTGGNGVGYYYWDGTNWESIFGVKRIRDLFDGKTDSGGSSIFLGIDAGQNSVLENRANIGIGFQTLFSISFGQNNVASGYQALYSNFDGYSNIANGYRSLFSNTDGYNNSATGYRALYSNIIGYNNIANGNEALYSNTNGNNNTANGFHALYSNIDGLSNIATGYRALYSNVNGDYNIANGYEALYSNTIGENNIVNGYQALYSNTDGSSNTATGYRALYSNIGGDSNIATGYEALYSNTIGFNNTATGYQTLYSNTSGYNNIGIGNGALSRNLVGFNNLALGRAAGFNNTSNNNVFLGYESGRGAGVTPNPASDNVFIGYQSGYNETNSNRLYIENSNSISPLIYGEFDTDLLRINGTLDINNAYQFPIVDGTVNQVLATDGAGVMSWTTPTVGEITSVTAGTGLTGGGTTGAITLNAVATNGLTTNPNDIRLGGTLIQNTTITQGIYGMTYNLSSTGDFTIQDAGINHFQVNNGGLSFFGDDTYWRDGSTAGTNLAILSDDGDDGRFRILENGITAVDLDANSQFIFNEQGLDRNFRVESNTNASMLFVDAGLNRVGIGTTVPVATFHVNGGRVEFTGTTDASGATGTGVLEIGNTLRIDGNEIITNQNTGLFLQNLNNGDLYIDNNTLVVDASTNRVGIGTVAPSYQLHVTTNSAAKPTSAAWTTISDVRLKTNVRPFTDGLGLLEQINPVWFTYNGKAGMPLDTGVGTLAQEFQKIAPYMVKPWEYTSVENGSTETYLGIDYGPLSFVIVNAIQEQQEIIKNQNQKIETLEQKLELQQKEIDDIKVLLKKL